MYYKLHSVMVLKQMLYVIKMKKYMSKEYDTKLRCLHKLNFKPINFQILKTLSKYSLVNQVVVLGNEISVLASETVPKVHFLR